MGIRNPTTYWRQLADHVATLERCFESCARLDAHAADGLAVDPHVRDALDHRLLRLRHAVDGELTRLTAERLIADVKRRQGVHVQMREYTKARRARLRLIRAAVV